MLVKAQNITVTKNDLIGTYATSYGPVMITSDGMYSEHFAATQTSIFNFNMKQSSWDFYSYQQGERTWITSCDLTANKACKILKQWNNKVVATSENGFYVLGTNTAYESDGSLDGTSFSLTYMSKLPKITFFSDWFTQNFERQFYQQTATGFKVWSFDGHTISIDDKASVYRSVEQKLSEYKLTQGKLYYEQDGSKRVLELISANENGLIVCEYNEGASCDKSTEFLLSNRSPAAISFSVVGQGSIEYPAATSFGYGSDTIFYTPYRIFGSATAFAIKADPGYEVVSVSGCGGTLNGAIYKTAIIKDKCTISAVFKKTGS